MTTDLPKPHFTIVIDDTVGDIATLAETTDGEIICTLHPSAVEDDSPARVHGHTVFCKAVEMVMRRVTGVATSPN